MKLWKYFLIKKKQGNREFPCERTIKILYHEKRKSGSGKNETNKKT